MNDQKPVVKYRADYTPPSYGIDDLLLEFDLNDDHTLVTQTAKYRRLIPGSTVPLVLDGVELELVNAKLNGVLLNPDQFNCEEESLTIANLPDQFELQLKTRILPHQNFSLEGLYVSSGNYCTQCEAEGFRKITYFLDRPDVLTTYTTRITANKAKYPILLSNGNCIESGDLDEGKHFAVWRDPFAKPCYLFALVAGDLAEKSDQFTTKSGRQVALKIFTEHHSIDKVDHALESLKKSMQWDEEVYGLEYDLDIYMIVAVGDFNMGAMENKGLNVFNSKYVLAKPETATDTDFENIENVIAHEYFHNWTGNRVTCRDWFQLSLKEGLTVFRDQQFTADMTSAAVKRINDVRVLRSAQFPEDSGPMAHPIRPDSYIEMNNFYTVTVYNKGAEVIRMYHTLLGDEGFHKGMRLYFERHDGRAVTCDDFLSAMADANEKDLAVFSRWYSQAGTPKVTVSTEFNKDAETLSMTVTQSCTDAQNQSGAEPFHIPIRTALLDARSGNIVSTRRQDDDQTQTEWILELTEQTQTFQFAPIKDPVVPSLLRGFSAPVKLEYAYSDDDLAFLLANDTDEFARWEAGQTLTLRILQRQIEAIEQGTAFTIPTTYFEALLQTLTDESLDPALRALALTLPSEQFLMDQYALVPIDALITAREVMRFQISQALENDFTQIYLQLNRKKPYQFKKQDVAERSLKNTCLGYLSKLKNDEYWQWCHEQINDANNMTDEISALTMLADSNYTQREKVLSAFYEKWQHDALVVDKWFATQASCKRDTALAEVKTLMKHPAFQMRNPNRVRALVGTFCHSNLQGFHQLNGAGYQYAANKIIELNTINPQVAARIASAFLKWKRFDNVRQQQMRKEMQRVLDTDGLSKDVFELFNKALGS